MSAASSKRSSKPKLILTHLENLYSQKEDKSNKVVSKYSSNDKKQKQSLKSYKNQLKPKKSLAKQFQTFNVRQEQTEKKYSRNNSKKNIKQKSYQLTANLTEPNTDIKNRSLSKNTIQKKKSQRSMTKIQPKTTDQKQMPDLKRINTKSPILQLQKSKKSASQVQNKYSKLQNKDKIVASKLQYYQKSAVNRPNNQNTDKQQQKTKQSVSQSIKKRYKKDSIRQESPSTKQKMLQIEEGMHLVFPHAVTESESIYPSSSYPNTGKQSNNQATNRNQIPLQSKDISQEQQEQGQYLENDQFQDYIQSSSKDKQSESDYIQQSENDWQNRKHHQIREAKQLFTAQKSHLDFHKKSQLLKKSSTQAGYLQLPQSYIIAMQTLQQKVKQQEKFILKLNKKLQKQKTDKKQLITAVQDLQVRLKQSQENMLKKDHEIQFLKGYLNEQKNNNREALKQVAKNVYQRSISKKQTQTPTKSEYFYHGKQNQNMRGSQNKRQTVPINQINQINPIQVLKYQQNLNAMKVRQLQLLKQKEQLDKLEEQVKLMRLRTQNIQINAPDHLTMSKPNHKFENQFKNQKPLLTQLYPHTTKKRQYEPIYQEQAQISSLKSRYSDNKRQRSITTDPKYSRRDQSDTVNFTDRNQRNAFKYDQSPSFAKQFAGSQVQQQRKQQILTDPVLQKLIEAKSIRNQSLFNNYRKSNKQQQQNIKSSKKNKQTVSNMRQIMRYQKQLITLNYKMQALQKRILQCVQSPNNQQQQSFQEKVRQKYILEDLQTQYQIIKRQLETKQYKLNQLKSQYSSDNNLNI